MRQSEHRGVRIGRRTARITAAIVGWACLLLGAGSFRVDAAKSLGGRKAPARREVSESQAPSRTATGQPEPTVAAERALLDQYCVTCHNEKLKTAGLALDTVSLEHLGESAEVWEKVAHMLRTGAMPPTGRKRPEPEAARSFAASLERGLDEAAAASPNFGRVPPHRLNRTEYANAIRDLLNVEVPSSML